MLVSPWRRRQAVAESARRRNSESTYVDPLVVDAADDEFLHSINTLEEFMKDFHSTFYTPEKLRARTQLLKDHPEVEAHLAVLVPARATEEEFWQRYEYRCDVDRILAEWERNPEKGREARGEALANGVQGWLDSSVRNLRNSFLDPNKDKDVHAKGKDSFPDKSKKGASASENKLEDSLEATRRDIERWATMDAKDAVAQMPARSLEEVAAEKKEKGQVDVAAGEKRGEKEKEAKGDSDNNNGGKDDENPIVKWFNGLVEEAGRNNSNGNGNERDAAKSEKGVSSQPTKATRVLNETTTEQSDSSNSSSSQATSSAETNVTDKKKKKISRLEQYRKSRKYQEDALTAKRDVAEIRAKISAKEKALEALAAIRARAETNETIGSAVEQLVKHRAVVLALLVGFLANALVKGMVNYVCAPYPESDVYLPPPRWYTIRGVTSGVRGLICEDVADSNQVAVEVFDNNAARRNGRGRKKRDYRRGDENRNVGGNGAYRGSYSDSPDRYNAAGGAKSSRGGYQRNYDDHDAYADADNYGSDDDDIGTFGGFDVNAMLSSFMKNTDFSQYNGGGGEDINDDDDWEDGGIAMSPSAEPNPKSKKKRGVVGFFKNRFGKNKSNELAMMQREQNQPSVVVHQHVHHVVHHVVHEIK